MQVAGIIAEYNPFHNGHAYHIAQVRRAGATHVIAVMSGNFVQRGEPAILEKHARAEMALYGGADLVLELPMPWCCARAQDFAGAGITLLQATGCVQLLAFGSECGDTGRLLQAAQALEAPQVKECLRGLLAQGLPLPAARERAAAQCLGEELSSLLRGANDTLALEYLRALERLNAFIRPLAIRRTGAMHDAEAGTDGFCSASRLRSLIHKGAPAWEHAMPAQVAAILRREIAARKAPVDYCALETAVLARLRRMPPEEWALLPDISEGLEHRLYHATHSATSLEELLTAAKTKRYTLARIRRLVLHAFLGITQEVMHLPPPYLRVLGFNERGQELLRQMRTTATLPVILRACDVQPLSPEARSIYRLGAEATDLFALAMPHKYPCGLEQTQNIVRARLSP